MHPSVMFFFFCWKSHSAHFFELNQPIYIINITDAGAQRRTKQNNISLQTGHKCVCIKHINIIIINIIIAHKTFPGRQLAVYPRITRLKRNICDAVALLFFFCFVCCSLYSKLFYLFLVVQKNIFTSIVVCGAVMFVSLPPPPLYSDEQTKDILRVRFVVNMRCYFVTKVCVCFFFCVANSYKCKRCGKKTGSNMRERMLKYLSTKKKMFCKKLFSFVIFGIVLRGGG